jgi:hypothetical protein
LLGLEVLVADPFWELARIPLPGSPGRHGVLVMLLPICTPKLVDHLLKFQERLSLELSPTIQDLLLAESTHI